MMGISGEFIDSLVTHIVVSVGKVNFASQGTFKTFVAPATI